MFAFQGAAAPRSISSEVEEGGRGKMGPDGDWTSVDPNLALNSVDSSQVLKTMDGRFPSKTSMERLSCKLGFLIHFNLFLKMVNKK